ncbi:MAG: amidohydrolase family protein [Bacteroidales bacterium]|nr:amidohydrolase family protein [Bacteroidales bacterium]
MHIDAHHHFWQYNPVEYDWIDDSMKKIRKDFLPGHLMDELKKTSIEGVISVQARQIIEETEWLLEFANEHSFIKGVTGWLPLIDPEIDKYLEKYSANKKLKAVRHVLQGEADNYMLADNFYRGIQALKKYNLIYEVLITESQLGNSIKVVDMHPDQIFVLDHIAKPLIKEGIISPWKENIIELSKRNNIYCKISGMVTEADFQSWTPESLFPYMEVVLEAFGPERLLFGSDWPVCEVACEYSEWVDLVKKFLSQLSNIESDMIMGKNAIKIYNL